VGIGTSIAFRRRFGLWLTATSAALAVLVVIAPQSRLWNARILPFWYLFLYFLAAAAVVELIGAVSVLMAKEPTVPRRGLLLGGPIDVALVTPVAVALPVWSLPFRHVTKGRPAHSWL